MFDDKSIDVSKEVDMVWSIANSLRGTYTSDKYKDVIIPMVILRRFECALAPTKDKVVELHKKDPQTPSKILCRTSKFPFYNTSDYTLKKLLDDPDNIETNLTSYIKGFSDNVYTIIERNLKFSAQIEKMGKSNRLYSVVQKFSDLDLDPLTVDNIKMGYIFEEIIRRFSENAEAGDHYTPREVIRLMTNLLLAEGCDDVLTDDEKVVTVLDAACGSGGMLSTAMDFIRRLNPSANVRLFGQEINPESYAICLADMLIKGQDIDNIRGGAEANTLMYDCFPDQTMRLAIMNPPFGTPWGGKDAPKNQETAVRNEEHGRFRHGLPATTDSQLLFMQHAINKLNDEGRAAIITNGSPLFSGNTTSGESQIRRWMLESDLVEAIVALTGQLFYNTDIGIYIFILSKNKREERKGKVQLINAVDLWKPLKKSLGKKRREIDKDSMTKITRIYSDFKDEERSRILPNEEFIYREYAVYQPLQRSASITENDIERIRNSDYLKQKLFNKTKFDELELMNPRSDKEEKERQKLLASKELADKIILTLQGLSSDKIYSDYGEFQNLLKKPLKNIGCSDSVINNLCEELSWMDKGAVIQKDKKGKVILDPKTKDTEIVKLSESVDEYFDREVWPFVPDAVYCFEFNPDKKVSSTNVDRTGAEFPFARYFYKFVPPESSENIASIIISLEKEQADVLRRIFDEL